MIRIRPSRWFVLTLTIAVCAGLAASPAGASRIAREVGPKVTVTGKALPISDKEGTAQDPAIGKPAPTISGKSFNGKAVKIGGPGVPRAVVFVAHWCPHCQAEVPLLVKLAKADKLSGVPIEGVATNTSDQYPNYPPSKWLKRERWPFGPVLADDAKSRALRAYGGNSFPYFVLLDASGNVVVRASGELPQATITSSLAKLAAGQPVLAAG